MQGRGAQFGDERSQVLLAIGGLKALMLRLGLMPQRGNKNKDSSPEG